MHMLANDRATRLKLLVFFVTLFGVILPFVAIGTVAENDFLREASFNPTPNAFYILMVCTVPVANAFIAVALWRGEPALSRPVAWLHTFSVGVALAYSMHFAPLLPIAALLVFSYGIGLLPLSPLLALMAAWLGRRRLKGMPPLWAGVLMTMFCLVLADHSAIATRVGLKMALAESPTLRTAGRYVLRHAGSEEVLKWTCESNVRSQLGAPGAFALNMLLPVTKDQARRVYYELNGVHYVWLP
jgi:hypothetical protein